jgi:hypothetical protein
VHCGFFAPIFLELEYITLQKVTREMLYTMIPYNMLAHGHGKNCEEPEPFLYPEDALPLNQNVSSLLGGFL